MPNFSVRILDPLQDSRALRESMALVKDYFCADKPYIDPEVILRNASFLVGGIRNSNGHETLVSTACVTHFNGCPDKPDDTSNFVRCLVTHPAHRGHGYGAKVYNAALKEAKANGLHDIYAIASNELQVMFLIAKHRRWLWQSSWVWVRNGIYPRTQVPFVLLKTRL